MLDDKVDVSARIPHVLIDGLPIDAVQFNTAVSLIAGWAEDGSGGYVCTPNVDHVVRARRDPLFRAAVLGARLRAPDGMGIVYGSRIAGRPLSGSVTGRLLPEAVSDALRDREVSIGLLGGRAGDAARAASKVESRGTRVSAAVEPSMGFEVGSSEDDDVVRFLQEQSPAVLFVGLGAPKQELWMARHAADLPNTVLVGVGAAIDVLGGRVSAAPAWMTRVGLEWLYRLAHEPRRLARRYLWDDPRFFGWMLAARIRNQGSPQPGGES